MSWLPQDYKAPMGNSSYTKLEDGENKVRIITAPIIGYEDWDNKRPLRYRMENRPDHPIDPEKPIKHFWSFVVWNYKTQKIEIFHVTQRMIQRKIEYLSRDSDWGDPTGYDIKIEKSGSAKETKYEVSPTPKREVDFEIQEAFHDRPVDLDEMFRSGDPFVTTEEHRTKSFWEIEKTLPAQPARDFVSRVEIDGIENLIKLYINHKAPSWRSDLLKAIKIPSFEQLEKKYYPLALKRIDEKRKAILEEEAKILTTDDIPF